MALPPKQWFHGNQFKSTGGSATSSVEVIDFGITEFTHIMRVVIMTALGMPVEPDVKRYLAT